MKHFNKILALFPLLLAVIVPTQAFAQTTINITRGSGGVSDLGTLISASFNMAIIIAILFVFLMLIIGGYGWLTAGGDKSKVDDARTRITNALIGMAIIASAWVMITIIAQFFGVDFETLELPTASEPFSF